MTHSPPLPSLDFRALAAAGLAASPSPPRAQALLTDMLSMPRGSHLSKPGLPENIAWVDACLVAGAALNGRSRLPIGALPERLKALIALGADLEAGKALHRATHRKETEEALAVLSLPQSPKPSQASGSGASALHRGAYAGPDALFAALAAHAEPAHWALKDKDGRTPLEKAFLSQRINRARLAASLTPQDLSADASGNTLYHRTALFISAVDPSEQDKWIALFLSLLERHPAAVFLKNNAGSPPAQLLPGKALANVERALLDDNARSAPAKPKGGRI